MKIAITEEQALRFFTYRKSLKNLAFLLAIFTVFGSIAFLTLTGVSRSDAAETAARVQFETECRALGGTVVKFSESGSPNCVRDPNFLDNEILRRIKDSK